MELSVFLAKFFGIFLLILALLWLLRREQFEGLVREIFSSKGLLGITGIINLILGIVLVVAHPIWVIGWPVLITLFGFMGIFQGVMRIGFPEECKNFGLKMLQNYQWLLLTILIVLGLYLSYSGFSA